MSNAIYAQHRTEIQDIIKQVYYTEDCEIDSKMNFQKRSGFIYFSRSKLLKFHDFCGFFMPARTLNVTIGCDYLNQTKI